MARLLGLERASWIYLALVPGSSGSFSGRSGIVAAFHNDGLGSGEGIHLPRTHG